MLLVNGSCHINGKSKRRVQSLKAYVMSHDRSNSTRRNELCSQFVRAILADDLAPVAWCVRECGYNRAIRYRCYGEERIAAHCAATSRPTVDGSVDHRGRRPSRSRADLTQHGRTGALRRVRTRCEDTRDCDHSSQLPLDLEDQCAGGRAAKLTTVRAKT